MSTVVDAPHRRVTLEEVRAHRDEIHAAAERYGISNIRVFGPVARGEADDDSDLDLLVDIEAGRDLFDPSGFALDVEEAVGVFTQVTTRNGPRKRMREHVLDESVPVRASAPPGTRSRHAGPRANSTEARTVLLRGSYLGHQGPMGTRTPHRDHGRSRQPR